MNEISGLCQSNKETSTSESPNGDVFPTESQGIHWGPLLTPSDSLLLQNDINQMLTILIKLLISSWVPPFTIGHTGRETAITFVG